MGAGIAVFTQPGSGQRQCIKFATAPGYIYRKSKTDGGGIGIFLHNPKLKSLYVFRLRCCHCGGFSFRQSFKVFSCFSHERLVISTTKTNGQIGLIVMGLVKLLDIIQSNRFNTCHVPFFNVFIGRSLENKFIHDLFSQHFILGVTKRFLQVIEQIALHSLKIFLL